jgi:acyl carrier protein
LQPAAIFFLLPDRNAMHEHLKIADDERLRMIIADVLGISTHKVLAKAALGLDLHATSLDLMEIVVGVEEAFQLVIHDREVAELVFVADFESLIRRRQAEEDTKATLLPTRTTPGRWSTVGPAK